MMRCVPLEHGAKVRSFSVPAKCFDCFSPEQPFLLMQIKFPLSYLATYFSSSFSFSPRASPRHSMFEATILPSLSSRYTVGTLFTLNRSATP